MPKSTRYGGASNEYDPAAVDVPGGEEPVEEAEVVEEAEPASVDEDSPVPPGVPYDTWLLVELRDQLAGRELPTSGNKPDLIARLVAHDEAQA